MSNPLIAWALLLPVILGVITTLGYIVQGRFRLPERGRLWLNVAGMATACAGLLLGPLLVLLAQGEVNLAWLGVTLAVSPLTWLGLASTSVAMLCSIIVSWSSRPPDRILRMVSAIMFTAGLLWAAILVTDRLVSTLCLFGAALAVSVIAAFPLVTAVGGAVNQGSEARLLEGGWKHVAMAVVATALLIAGVLMVARHALNLENPGTLQVGLGLLSVGLVMRAGAMPFATGSADLTEAAPEAAILMLGAVSPAVIIVGLLTFAPLGVELSGASPAERQVALGLGAIAALLAGVRALASAEAHERSEVETPGARDARLAVLVSSSVALQIGWALFGVFSGSRMGTLGAALLAVNLALAVPLIIAGTSPKSKVQSPKSRHRTFDFGLWTLDFGPAGVGAGTLLGLPPLGGFVGTMLVAQAAVEVNGAWLLPLLLGSAGVALAWLRAIDWLRSSVESEAGSATQPPAIRSTPADLLCGMLVAAQAIWFVLSFFIVI